MVVSSCSNNQFVLYRRVSTSTQGSSGLGLDAQLESIQGFLSGIPAAQVIQEFVEVESGKEDQNRPELSAAMDCARKTGATILVSKLCRLSRDLEFIARLMKDSRVRFRVASMPDADEFSLSIWACMVQQERRLISERTKDAISAARKKGVQWGTAGKKNIKKCNDARIEQADAFAEKLASIVTPMRENGMTYQSIANRLNQMDIKTARGSIFNPIQVKRVLDRTLK